MNASQPDLRELAIQRSPEPDTAAIHAGGSYHRRQRLTRYGVPAGMLLALMALLTIANKDLLLSRNQVTVVPVIVKRSNVQLTGTPAFQAAGWIEPRPTPIHVAALTSGVVDQLLVVEGQEVTAGQTVAKLIDVDARISLRQAEAEYALRVAEQERADAELKAAKLRRQHPVHLQAQVAEAEALLANTETMLGQIPFLVESAKARAAYARQNRDGKRAADTAVSGRALQAAESSLADAAAELEELEQRRPRLQREQNALQAKVAALKRRLDLLIDETRELENAQALVHASNAKLDAAQVSIERAELELRRTQIVAPHTGRVLSLIAYPGMRVAGLDSNAGHSASTVITLYDPSQLQVRADVRLEDVPHVMQGQRVEIQTASTNQIIPGTVLLLTASANIQKNTLEVKVAIDDPPPSLRPEMLVSVTFLASQPDASTDPAANPSDSLDQQHVDRIWIPTEVVQQHDGQPIVWIAAADGTAHRQRVRLGRAQDGGLIEVIEGLAPTDKLIASSREQLEPGARIVTIGDDPRIGL
jgi:multidrug efflux pump subunit AcrA (membrane-fusion protein)